MDYSIRHLLNLDGSTSESPAVEEEDIFAAGVQEEAEMVGEQGDSLVREADSEQQSKSDLLAS